MGLAVGDDSTGVVSPMEVVSYEGRVSAARYIAETARRIDAGRVVIGLPTLEDGSLGPAARRSQLLAEIVGELGLDVALQSEFLSTDEARRRAGSVGRRRGQPVDDIAAQVILEEYLATRTSSAEV